MKCPKCNHSRITIKWNNLLECKDCGEHFYGDINEVEAFDEAVPEPPKMTPEEIALAYLKDHPELLSFSKPTERTESELDEDAVEGVTEVPTEATVTKKTYNFQKKKKVTE